MEEREVFNCEKARKALTLVRKKVDALIAVSLESCVRCGLCRQSCHYSLTDRDFRCLPAYKLKLVSQFFKRHFTFPAKKFGRWVRAKDLDSISIEEWVDSLFGRCSLCGRCSTQCSVGINILQVVRAGRSLLTGLGYLPAQLEEVVHLALKTGNNMGISTEEWKETVAWLEEELRQEVQDPTARLPLDERGTRILYIINPREAKFFPLSLIAAGKVFHAAAESWTLSSRCFDVTNYGYFAGDEEVSARISESLVKAAEELGAHVLVLSECGHGFNSHRWEAPDWLARKFDFPVESMVQVLAEYIREGRIMVNPESNPEPVTLHDPCNLVRLGGVVEEPRYVLKKITKNFREMRPNREKNFCCGGGGGQLAMTAYAERRLRAGRIKAEQVQRAAAKIVIAPCHNCVDQLMELNRHYKLGVEVKTLTEFVADSLIIKS